MNKHVFKKRTDGTLELVGNFDQLYATENDPWSQSAVDHSDPMAQYYFASRREIAYYIKRIVAPKDNILEVGCGFGHAASYMDRIVNTKFLSARFFGADISQQAVNKARLLHPKVGFSVGDVTEPKGLFYPDASLNIVIWSQCWWYLLDKLEAAITETMRVTKPGQLFIVHQAFLKTEQRFHPEINGFQGAVDILADMLRGRAKLAEARFIASPMWPHDDGMIVFVKDPS